MEERHRKTFKEQIETEGKCVRERELTFAREPEVPGVVCTVRPVAQHRYRERYRETEGHSGSDKDRGKVCERENLLLPGNPRYQELYAPSVP